MHCDNCPELKKYLKTNHHNNKGYVGGFQEFLRKVSCFKFMCIKESTFHSRHD